MKLKFGMIVTDGVNKIGGHVISENHYGRFARTYIIPPDPRTAPQISRRALFQTYALSWKTLTSTQQAAWIAATVNYPRTDSLGNIYYPSGQNLYIELNTNLVFIGQSAVTSPPTKVVPAAPPSFSLTANASGSDFHISFPLPYTDTTVVVCLQSTFSLSTGITVVFKQVRNIKQFAAAAVSTVAFFPDYTAYFGSPTVGKKIFVKLYVVHKTSGSITQGASVAAIIT